MKIKLSKSQWQEIGKKAGWIHAQIIPDDGIADGGTPYTDEEMDLMEPKNGKMNYYPIDRFTIPGVPNTRLDFSGLSLSELKRGHRVIGGDRGDLLFQGYTVNDDNTTDLHKPVLRTALELTGDEADGIAHEIFDQSFASIGWEAIYHS